MISHVTKSQAAIEDLKRFFMATSLEDINKKLNNLYIVLILRSLHLGFDYVCDQILAADQIPSTDNLVTILLRLMLLKHQQ